MAKLSLKNIIIFSIFIVYITFSVIIFFIYNNYYMKNAMKEFVEQNNYSAKVASDMIANEKSKLVITARMIATDDMIYHALKNNKYIENKWDVYDKYIKIDVREIDKLGYRNLVNLVRNKVYGTGRGSEESGVEIFKSNFERVGNSSYFPREFLDDGSEDYIRDSFGEQNLGGVEISFAEKRGEQFFLKGTAPVGKNTRYLYENPVGVVVTGKRLDGIVLDAIKKIVNREVMIYSNNKIITSTIFKELERYENKELKIENIKSYDDQFFARVQIEKREMGITFIPLKDYHGKIIAYIGIGNSLETMKGVYYEAVKNFIKYEMIFSLIIFILFFVALRRIFKPLDRILERIIEIKNGNYEKKIEVKRERYEVQTIVDGINSLSDAVQKREEELINLNQNLELKVLSRTKELNVKNDQLERLIGEVKRVNRKMTEELEAAKKIHRKINEFRIPELKGYKIDVENISIGGIGGDFTEIIRLENGKIGVFFADVAGHGVAAALMVSALKIIISLYFAKVEKPAEALYILNEIINESFIEGITVSAIYLIIDDESSKVELSLGAQEDVYIVGREGVRKIKEKGIILGVLDNQDIAENDLVSFKNIEITLEKNEKIFLYTDGLVEKGIMDREGLLEILNKLKNDDLEGMLEFFKKNIKPVIEAKEKDDVTYLIIEKSC